jgi:hypothetical protein
MLSVDFLDLDASAMEAILQKVRQRVAERVHETDPYHGKVHASQVESNVRHIMAQPDIHVSEQQMWLLRLAALLHDVGYGAKEPSWSADSREHVQASLEIVTEISQEISSIAAPKPVFWMLVYLIAHHDDTNYQYPSMVTAGEVHRPPLGRFEPGIDSLVSSLAPAELSTLRYLLGVLREADALAATGTGGANRTLEYSNARGIAPFSRGNPLSAWAWEESVVGNVRLAAKRLQIDAISREGKQTAHARYDEGERVVEEFCAAHRVRYFPESYIRPDSQTVLGSNASIRRYQPWPKLEKILSEIRLAGDDEIRPYQTAEMRPRLISLDELRPLSYYVLESTLQSHRNLVRYLEEQYGLSLFDLTGVLDMERDNKIRPLGPPILERYYETTEGEEIVALVDGLHRVWVARELGIKSIWAIEITGVPPEYPLVPLPISWADVRVTTSVPEQRKKRKFRFPNRASFPDVSELTDVPITDANYLYFFYRRLDDLGSSGIRE